ncbi:response regulator [Roseixanthobacter pseudopolyaromaticivorans]|uniref:response regulator n=1 Tax=Xanthobacteraceae TaxID=335928 RepID=UPI00372C6587
MQSERVNLLLLEDSAVDAELICHQLRSSFGEATITQASIRPVYEDLLRERVFDVILSDYSIPDFLGLEALSIARAVQPETPFIFISGVLGEERATEAMRAGATDYITKRDLSRIPMVVDRALREARQRRAAREADSARAASEERYRSLFNSIEAGFCIIEVVFDETGAACDYRFLEVNPAFERQTGLGAALGRRMRELVPAHEQHWFEVYGHVAKTGEAARFEQVASHLNRWFDVYAYRVGRPEENRVAILFNDISQRRASEEALKESEAHYRFAAELNPQVAWTARPDGTRDRVAERWTAWTGLSGLGASWNEGLHPEDRARAIEGWHRSVESGEPYDVEHRVLMRSGAVRWARSRAYPRRDDKGNIVKWYGTTEDNHERKLAEGELLRLNETLEQRIMERTAELVRAQEALRQSQKLEAMGQLTGGVAHDFNNLLTPIIGSLDLLQRRGVGDARTRPLIEGALQAAERAKTLVQRLLAFARRQPLQPTSVDVGSLVLGMGDLIAATSGPRIKVTAAAPEDLPPAHADANQLEMAILNLAVNARDAMPDGGTLTISAQAERVSRGHPSKLPPGAYLRLSVVDTGIGMDTETLSRAVEPFFSTKGIGKGTGLGLSMVHGLAAQLGGGLTLESRVGDGARADLWLPVAHGASPPAAEPAERVVDGGGGTVLLVDDEQLVRISTAEILADLGYSVVSASSAEAALRLLSEGLRPTVMVTDHLMAGMTGADLAHSAVVKEAGLPVVLVSGYSEDPRIAANLVRLNKPFRRAELAKALMEAVHRQA